MSISNAVQRQYDEEFELLRYVWRNYHHLRTERECALREAAILETKARQALSSGSAEGYRDMAGYFLDAEVAAIADSGLDSFDRLCCRRILQDYVDDIYINRCEHCGRIVVSPIACTCLWCGHNWYERRSEMVARATTTIYPKS